MLAVAVDQEGGVARAGVRPLVDVEGAPGAGEDVRAGVGHVFLLLLRGGRPAGAAFPGGPDGGIFPGGRSEVYSPKLAVLINDWQCR
ncbi:hypothetical protein ACE1SV_06260 [Streptomyces sennicomposti]